MLGFYSISEMPLSTLTMTPQEELALPVGSVHIEFSGFSPTVAITAWTPTVEFQAS